MKYLSIDDFTIFNTDNVKAFLKDYNFLQNLDKKSKIFKKGRGYVIKIDSYIIRFYFHGGIFRKILSDRFLFSERFINELKIHNYLYNSGLNVPEPVGIIFFKKFFWYHGVFITKFIENSCNIVDFLKNSFNNIDEIFFKIGKLTNELHKLDVIHSDLHIKNFLIDNSKKLYIIDFDKSFISNDKNLKKRELKRFIRSIYKINFFYPNFIKEENIKYFLSGYGLSNEDINKLLKEINITMLNKISWILNKPVDI